MDLTSKYGKNISETLSCASWVTFLFIPRTKFLNDLGFAQFPIGPISCGRKKKLSHLRVNNIILPYQSNF